MGGQRFKEAIRPEVELRFPGIDAVFRDNNRHACSPAGEASPQVSGEQMGVDEINRLTPDQLPQAGDESPVQLPAFLQAEDGHPALLEYGGEPAFFRQAGNEGLEPTVIQALRQADDHLLRAA